MTHTVLLIPHDVDQPATVHQVGEDFAALSMLTFGEDRTMDAITDLRRGFQVFLDDLGLLRSPREPVNVRASALTRYPAPLVGNVVVLGVDEAGEWLDVPQDVIDLVQNYFTGV